jgi:hypothetical protein
MPTESSESLSPDAQSIDDAFNGYHELVNRRVKIAAVLRAIAELCEPDLVFGLKTIRQGKLISLAIELEGPTGPQG